MKEFKKNPNVSIIIRTKNEQKYLGQVLKLIKKQTYQDFEIIIVDDSSTDNTLKIAKKYNCKIIKIAKGKFTYPYACNYGIKNASGQYIVFLSGHSLPRSFHWLEDGLANFKNKKVAGIYGVPFALPDANLVEKFFYSFSRIFKNRKIEITKTDDVGLGVLGFTNAIIRKDLWEKYNINEKFERGGEDGDWGRYWVRKGYVLVHDPKFKVYHSHNLGLIDLLRQLVGWLKMGSPKKFKAQKHNFK